MGGARGNGANVGWRCYSVPPGSARTSNRGAAINDFTAICYNLACYLPFLGGTLLARERTQPGQATGRAPVTLALAALVAIPSLLQLAIPALLPAPQRDRDLILHDGQVWRLVAALIVQDGGLIGLIFNPIPLVLLGTVAECLWGGRCLLALFFGTGILGQFVGLVWQPRGAGNPVGDFGIAMGLAVLYFLRARSVPPRLLGGMGIVGGSCRRRSATSPAAHARSGHSSPRSC